MMGFVSNLKSGPSGPDSFAVCSLSFAGATGAWHLGAGDYHSPQSVILTSPKQPKDLQLLLKPSPFKRVPGDRTLPFRRAHSLAGRF
jgi:hypothetical protein